MQQPIKLTNEEIAELNALIAAQDRSGKKDWWDDIRTKYSLLGVRKLKVNCEDPDGPNYGILINKDTGLILTTYVANEAQPADSQPADSQPADSQPVDSQPVDSQPVDSQPVEAKYADKLDSLCARIHIHPVQREYVLVSVQKFSNKEDMQQAMLQLTED